MPRFFRVEADLVPKTEETVIKMLTKLRQSGYIPRLIESIKPADLLIIQGMVTRIGKKILEANFHEDPKKLAELITQFNHSVNALVAAPSPYSFILFSTQLLQYYTLLCDEAFVPHESALDFCMFLDANKNKLGKTDTNLFITEYKIIKIYNDLNDFLDSISRKIAPIPDLKDKIQFNLNLLQDIKLKIKQWLLDAPDDIFIDYLDFSVNYAWAKAAELLFKLEENGLSAEDKIRIAELQKNFLKDALQSLRRFETNKRYHEERETLLYPGAEYSLGQGLFSKLPIDDLETIKSHLISLTSGDS